MYACLFIACPSFDWLVFRVKGFTEDVDEYSTPGTDLHTMLKVFFFFEGAKLLLFSPFFDVMAGRMLFVTVWL